MYSESASFVQNGSDDGYVFVCVQVGAGRKKVKCVLEEQWQH